MRRTDLLFHAGGECVQQYGTIVRKTLRDEDNGYTSTRSGAVGRYVSGLGVSLDAAANVPRVNYAGGVPYLLLEDARTNLALRSQEFDNASWTKTRASVTADQGTGGDGTTTADKLIDTADSDTHFLSQSITATADATYALSIEAQADDYDFIGLALIEAASFTNRVGALFDLTDGTVDNTTTNGTGAHTRSYVEDLGSGRYRLTLVGSVGNSATSIQARIWLADQSGRTVSTGWAGDASSGVLAWGAQFEDNVGHASSYMPTTTASASRSADTFYVNHLAPPQEMTTYVKFRAGGVSGGGSNERVFHVGSATGASTPRLAVYDGTSRFRLRHSNGVTAVTSGDDNLSAVSPLDVVELRCVLNSDGSVQMGQTINGGAEQTTSASGASSLKAAWADTRIYLNSAGSGNRGTNGFYSVKAARGVRTMAEMRGL